jgi:hypothetical protein
MTLGVNIVDKYSGNSLNENGKKYGVLLDDITSEIKTKIFVNTDNFYNETVPYYPNLTRLEIKRGDEYITITDQNCLLFFYDKLPETPVVYVSTIFNIINDERYKEFNLEAYDLYTKLKSDDNMITDLYDSLVLDFVELTQDDLSNIIKMKMFNFNRTSNILGSQENQSLMNDIKTFFNTIKSRVDTDLKIYKKEGYSLSRFYDHVYKYDYSTYYDWYETEGNPNFIYTTLNFTLKPKDYDTSAIGKFIKLDKIFNMIELSETIPLVAFNDSPRRTPKIKIYNKLIDTLNENSIKSWILNEKKKMQKASYKKIRGLIIKYRLPDIITSKPQNKYITININEMGFIQIKLNFEEDDNQRSIRDISKIVYNSVDDVISILNELYGVFTQSKRLQKTSDLVSDLVSVNAILETNRSINRAKFRKILNKTEGSKFFDSKDIKDMVSMYYKRFGKRDGDDDSERLGITVNIKDNPYKMNSSTIVIYGGYNLNQLKVIIDNIMVLSEIASELKKNIFEDSDSENDDEEIVLKERKQNIKKVREMGGKMSSITCQKKRQPKIENDTQIQDPELVMVYRGNKYICEGTGKHKYPGLSGDVPCCFEYPGKGMESIISANILEIKVQPSNFTVDVTSDGKSFKTFVIKVTSEDVENLDLSQSRYFYLSNDQNTELPLVHIHSPELVSQIERDAQNDKNESIWLVEVPLYQLISKPKKDKCLYIPQLHKTNADDINAPCEHHDKENKFGYNMKSYPCCFENKPPVYRLKKDDKTITTKQHIITTDKLLGYKRQGILQPGLNTLLNEMIGVKTGAFLRWGVNQNHLSFFNCIVESLSNNTDVKIDSTYALKRYLTNYLNDNPADFLRLNNGNISLKYGTIDEYLSAINSENVIHWSDVIDLIQIALKCNVLIVDIPFVESLSKTTFTYEDMRLVCNLNIQQDRNNPFLLLVKKQNSFELIVLNSSATWNKSSEKMQMLDKPQVIDFVFKYESGKNANENIVNFFVDYYNKSCRKENDFPEKYPYEELYTIEYIISKLQKTEHKVWFQLVNAFNKVNMVVTKLGLVIPVKETGVVDKIPMISFEEFVFKQKVISVDKVLELLDELNELDIKPKMKILGVTVNNGRYTGILTNFGQTIPVKQTELDSTITLPVLESKYYYNVDTELAKKDDRNKESDWNNTVSQHKIQIYDIKKQIGERLVTDNSTKETIVKINKTTDLTKLEKTSLIKDILRKYINSDIPDLDFILDNISNEVINDNVENLLLHNLITSEVFNPNEITKRSTESVWLNLDDIKKWFRKFKL